MMSLAGGLLSPPSAASLSFKRPLISSLTPHFIYHHREKSCQPRISNVTCKAEFSQDAPLAVAIGACILNSVIFPISPGPDDDLEESSLIDSADARLAVMGIISFIPYFNWLSWVFAWLDTGKQRYAVYSLVYLAPYLRSNLSISPEESWLPIASILFCIIHIQLEASIRNGDFQGFQLFGGSPNNLSSVIRKKQNPFQGDDGVPEEEGTEDYMNLPSARDQSRNEIRGWGVPEKPLQDSNHLNEDGDASNMKKQ